MSAIWDKAKGDALKILGAKGNVPDMPDTVEKAADVMGKADDEFVKGRKALEANVLALENANDGVVNSLKQFVAKIETSDFGLDLKNKDDLRKILQARQMLLAKLNTGIKQRQNDDKMLDELDKHIEQLGKYKPKAGSL